MAAKAAKPGSEYTYVGEQPIGVDANGLFPGQKVAVREVVPANEPGAHDTSEDAVVIEWESPSIVATEDGWGHGTAARAMSIGVSEFSTLFEEA